MTFPRAAGAWSAGAAIAVLVYATAAAPLDAWRKRSPTASPFDSLERDLPPPSRPEDLVRFERELGWRAYSQPEFAVNVAPVLARVLRARARARYGPAVAEDLQALRSRIDPALWSVIDPADVDREGPPVRTRDVARLLDLIESV